MFDIKKETQEIFFKNRRQVDGHMYTIPSAESYPHQWFWDSCFNAITLSHFDIEAAKAEMRSVISSQFLNGLIPHIIYREPSKVLNIDWGAENTSSLLQPPLLAYSVSRIFEKDKDKAFLEEMYLPMHAYYRYLMTRDTRNHHLIGLINPDESGEDNSPRFDITLGLPPKHSIEENNAKRFALIEMFRQCDFEFNGCMRNYFWVKDVPFNSYLIENLECMATFAHELKHQEDVDYFREKSELLREGMRSYMYEDGIYWSIYGYNHEKIKVKTWAIFAPLLAGLYSDAQAKDLIKKYLLDTEEFWSPYPLPTVALNEKGFNLKESTTTPAWLHPNWRGPVWMAVNWFVCRGLEKYGFDSEAEVIKSKSIKLLEQSGFREYYHPLTGEGMGACDFTWGGLVLDMVESSK